MQHISPVSTAVLVATLAGGNAGSDFVDTDLAALFGLLAAPGNAGRDFGAGSAFGGSCPGDMSDSARRGDQRSVEIFEG